MTTETDVINRSLQALGTRSNVAAVTERSEEARNMRILFNPTRDAMLRGAHWDFARKTDYLALLKSAPGTPENTSQGTVNWVPATQPAPPWLYSYAYPSDCLLVRTISPQIATGYTGGTPIFSTPSYIPIPMGGYRPQKFQIATDTNSQGAAIRNILSNQNQAIAIYTQRITNPDLWDELFQEAMVAALAFRVCNALTGDNNMRQQLRQDAISALTSARVSDGNEGFTVENWTPEWLAIRGVARDWSTSSSYATAWANPSFLGSF